MLDIQAKVLTLVRGPVEEEGKLLFIEGYSTTSSVWTHQRMRPSPLLPASAWLAPRSLGQMLVCPRVLGVSMLVLDVAMLFRPRGLGV